MPDIFVVLCAHFVWNFAGQISRPCSCSLQSNTNPPMDISFAEQLLLLLEVNKDILWFVIMCVCAHASLCACFSMCVKGVSLSFIKLTGLVLYIVLYMCVSYHAGSKYCKVNIHLLSHLPYYVKCFGPLWTHSVFVFGDCIGHFVQKAHGTHDVANQCKL